jgi:hypothetical protein
MFGYIRNSFYLCKVNETGGRKRLELYSTLPTTVI